MRSAPKTTPRVMSELPSALGRWPFHHGSCCCLLTLGVRGLGLVTQAPKQDSVQDPRQQLPDVLRSIRSAFICIECLRPDFGPRKVRGHHCFPCESENAAPAEVALRRPVFESFSSKSRSAAALGDALRNPVVDFGLDPSGRALA